MDGIVGETKYKKINRKGRVNKMNGITDIVATVTVPKTEYEYLVRESERLAILERYVKNGKYTTLDDVKTILGVGEKAGDQDDGN